MSHDPKKPIRAAKAAALENPVWLNGKAATSTFGKEKRAGVPDVVAAKAPVENSVSLNGKGPTSTSVKGKRLRTSDAVPSASTSTKKARIVGNVRTPNPKSKPRKHVTTQPLGSPQVHVQVVADTKRKPVPRLSPVQIEVDLESDQDVGLLQDDDDCKDSDNKDSQFGGDDANSTFSDGEDWSDQGQDNIEDLEPSAVRARFENEGAKWGMDNNAGSDGVDRPADNSEGPEEDLINASSDEDVKVIGTRATNRLAEVPQWISNGAESTCEDSGTPLSSDEEDDVEVVDNSQLSMFRYTVNKGWPPACHYVPADSGRALIKLRIQPSGLRMIIRGGIRKVTGDAIFETAYHAVDGLTKYLRLILWRTARSLNLLAYAKRFEQDSEFGKAIGRVLNGRISILRGTVKRIAANKVEGYYGLTNGQPGIDKIKQLILASTYIYPTKGGSDGREIFIRSKPFSHPAIITVLRDAFFVNVRGGSFASRHHERFESSLDSRPNELEIPSSMLALVATSIHSALDDHGTGVLRKTEFNADMYEDIYLGHMRFLSHIREGSITKYHRMMADLYIKASTVFVPRAAAVTHEAIAQLDLDGMVE